jgi:hypothetical protein
MDALKILSTHALNKFLNLIHVTFVQSPISFGISGISGIVQT